jgi:hypothetical protein
MGDEDVQIVWGQTPISLYGCAARIHESPIEKFRVYGEPQNVTLSIMTPLFSK